MFEYTSNNHHSWTINDVKWAWHSGPTDRFAVEFGKVNPSKVGDFRTEINRTVEEIHRKVSDEIFVTLSGGIDGEIICRAFMECGYKVTPVTYVYKHGINDYDLGYARDFCKKMDLKNLEIPMDAMDFFENRLDEYCDRYLLPHWICTWKAWLFDNFTDGFMIQAQGWPIVSANQRGEMVVSETNHNMNPLVLTGGVGIGDFFKYRPELTYSWLTDPDIYRWSRLMNRPFESLGGEKHFKFFALSKFYMNDAHPLSPREKVSGLERIQSFIERSVKRQQSKYRDNVKTALWGYDEYLSMLSL
jgi:hypothetical protein